MTKKNQYNNLTNLGIQNNKKTQCNQQESKYKTSEMTNLNPKSDIKLIKRFHYEVLIEIWLVQ